MTQKILWADDEIDLLKPHVLFLNKKGYEVTTVTNGQDALDLLRTQTFDLVFLDENMPGLSGLETLSLIKEMQPALPIIMITKSEEEDLMEQAIGGKIADYLIKPVLPNQMLLSIKKNLHAKEIQDQQSTSGYQQDYTRLTTLINCASSFDEWVEVYKDLVRWEIELETNESSLNEMLRMQKSEANSAFAKFVKKNYAQWIQSEPSDRPMLSTDVFRNTVFPMLDAGEKVFLIVIDNFRFDQWEAVKPLLSNWYNFKESVYCSILPTATQYARNAIFSGLLPIQIAQMFPNLWVDEDEEEGKNLNEAPLIETHLQRYRRNVAFSYHKINENNYGEKLLQNLNQLTTNPLNVIVMNFIDMLSHARTESRTIRELAPTEAAYRALTRTWMDHSVTTELFRRIAELGYKVIITTDHGSIKVDNPVKIIGDKNTNTNLRYKLGKNLNCASKQTFEIRKPKELGLPALNLSTSYVFCTGKDFFAYPNNYNYYVNYYKDTFQHGGISMEEMLVPLIVLNPKKRE